MLRCSILYSWWDVAHIRRGIMLAFVCCLLPLPPPVSPGGGTAEGSGLLRRSWFGIILISTSVLCVFSYVNTFVFLREKRIIIREAERFLTISEEISLWTDRLVFLCTDLLFFLGGLTKTKIDIYEDKDKT